MTYVSCGLLVIAYAIHIAFNVQQESSKYIITQMKNHTKISLLNNSSISYPKQSTYNNPLQRYPCG
jgi:hypothetical protein